MSCSLLCVQIWSIKAWFRDWENNSRFRSRISRRQSVQISFVNLSGFTFYWLYMRFCVYMCISSLPVNGSKLSVNGTYPPCVRLTHRPYTCCFIATYRNALNKATNTHLSLNWICLQVAPPSSAPFGIGPGTVPLVPRSRYTPLLHTSRNGTRWHRQPLT